MFTLNIHIFTSAYGDITPAYSMENLYKLKI